MEATAETRGRWSLLMMGATALSFIALLLGIVLAVTLSDRHDRMDGEQGTNDRGMVRGGPGYGVGDEDGAPGLRGGRTEDEGRAPPAHR
jgi:hypothetical protein